MIRKCKPGEFVEIKRNLKPGKKYGMLTWFAGMNYTSGAVVTILKITPSGNYAANNDFIYSRQMIKRKISVK